MGDTCRTWAEISLSALSHNYHTLRALAPSSQFLGVVKADAYGHGALAVSRHLKALGAECLAVACLEEGLALRQGGVEGKILLLGPTPATEMSALIEGSFIQTVGDVSEGQALSQAAGQRGLSLSIHVKVDTGMGRLGFYCGEDVSSAAEEIFALCALQHLAPQGIFTHFAYADGDPAYTEMQLTRFENLTAVLAERGLTFPLRHCSASAGTLACPQGALDMIRPGLALYGYLPDGTTAPPGLLIPALTLKSRVVALRALPAGSAVSYGCTHTLKQDSRLAVLPVGYGDGLPRCLSGRRSFAFGDALAPQIGRICMDMCMVDVTDLPSVSVGDVAVLYGEGAPLVEAAALAGTIPYELLCAISPRVPRLYTD